MDHRKPLLSRWYALGLAVLLTVGCLVMAVGVSWARYRTEADAKISVEVRPPLAVTLGRMEYSGESEIGTFVPTGAAVWEWVDGRWAMALAVANGTAPDVFEAQSQSFRIRFVGSLGAWSGEGSGAISLILPLKQIQMDTEETEDPADSTLPAVSAVPTRIAATATRISPDTRLHREFGDGWLFCFLDDQGEELSWTLEGGKLSCVTMDVVIDAGTLADTSLLQLQIVED